MINRYFLITLSSTFDILANLKEGSKHISSIVIFKSMVNAQSGNHLKYSVNDFYRYVSFSRWMGKLERNGLNIINLSKISTHCMQWIYIKLNKTTIEKLFPSSAQFLKEVDNEALLQLPTFGAKRYDTTLFLLRWLKYSGCIRKRINLKYATKVCNLY